MKKRTNAQILDAVAADFIPDQTDLTPLVMTRINREKRTLRQVRLSRYALLPVVVAIIILIVSVPGIASAMRQLFGFLPGVGMVDRSALVRVLQEPVSLERNGVTVTVEQVIALPERTVIQFKVSGIPNSAYPKHLPGSDPQGFLNACVDPLFLRLPDGGTLTYTGFNSLSGTTNVPQYEASFTVKPVPGEIDEVTLVMPCIDGTERDAIAGPWELPLRLISAPDKVDLSPVYDLTEPTPAGSETGPEPISTLSAPDSRQTSDQDIRLILDQVVVLPDGDQLYGRVQWGESLPYSDVTLDSFEMTDAQGQSVPLMQISPDPSKLPAPGSRFVPLAFKVDGLIQEPGPITLTADRLSAWMPVEDTRFIFNTGTDPQENQRWVLNQDFQVGKFTLRVVSVTRLVDGYEFSILPGSGVSCVDLYIQGTNHQRGECGQGIARVQFDGEVPSGVLTIIVANLNVQLTGSWQATWLPPEVEQNKVPKP